MLQTRISDFDHRNFYFVALAFGENLWVAPLGSGSACRGQKSSPCAVAEALALAGPGDVLMLLEGDYLVGGFEVNTSNVTIMADTGAEVAFVPEPDRVVLWTYIFKFTNVTNVFIRRIHFSSWNLTPIQVFGGRQADVSFEDCQFESNTPAMVPTVRGGAVYAEGGVAFRRCKFANNGAVASQAAFGGAVSVLLPCQVSGFRIHIENCMFVGTRANLHENTRSGTKQRNAHRAYALFFPRFLLHLFYLFPLFFSWGGGGGGARFCFSLKSLQETLQMR